MLGRDGGAERAGWNFTNSTDVIFAALRTRWNISFAIQLDVRRQVAGKIDRRVIGQIVFQGKLICGGINLAEVVDAGIRGTCMGTAKVLSQNPNQEADEANDDEQFRYWDFRT